MDKQFCSGCSRMRPKDEMRKKKLRTGGVRLVCAGCLLRAKTRSDEPKKDSDEKTDRMGSEPR